MADSTVTNPQPQSNLQVGGIDPNQLLAGIVNQQMGSSGLVSSTTSDLDQALQKAISGVQESTSKTSAATASSYDRQIADATQKGANDLSNGRAAGAGGVMNMAALRELTDTTDKNLKDLEQRKQELILQNDASGAAKVAELQMNALDFKQKAQQQVFTNLLGMSNYALQRQTNELAQRNQSFAESQSISAVALKYGLSVQPGDTIDSITSRAMPFASAEEKLGLAKMQADINNSNAQAAKYLADAGKTGLDASTAGVLANTYVNADPATQAYILGTIKNPTEMSTFMGEVEKSKQAKQGAIDAMIPQFATMSSKDIDNYFKTSNIPYTTDEVTSAKLKVKQYQLAHPPAAKPKEIPASSTKGGNIPSFTLPTYTPPGMGGNRSSNVSPGIVDWLNKQTGFTPK